MKEKDKLIIQALKIIQEWYECKSPVFKRELDNIIIKLEGKK